MSALSPSSILHLPEHPARAAAPRKPALPATGSAGVAGSLNSAEILRGQKAVEISHNGSTYRLQATRLGKLILTK